MDSIFDISKYREDSRTEAKSAQGGIPKSIWETYSAFANSYGGTIFLGADENKDGSLSVSGIAEHEKILKDFWNTINNSQKVSLNILSDKNVQVREINGKKLIVIEVPRAERSDKPVYIGQNPLTGTYRRNGEGDYKCTTAEVRAMLRDASFESQDMVVLDDMSLDMLDHDCIHRYRQRMKSYRPGHVWDDLDDHRFLHRINAAGRDGNGDLHPTAAGLLMFGNEHEIVTVFSDYFLDYRDQSDRSVRWADRFVSTSGEWSGNLYDFFFQTYKRIAIDLKTPFELNGCTRIDDTPVHKAIREALANCLVNADYYGKQGIVVIKEQNEITIANPGDFRIDTAAAKEGGISDPRNTAVMKMFNLIGIGERAGSGIPSIYEVWSKNGWQEPEIINTFQPARTVVRLPMKGGGTKRGIIEN